MVTPAWPCDFISHFQETCASQLQRSYPAMMWATQCLLVFVHRCYLAIEFICISRIKRVRFILIGGVQQALARFQLVEAGTTSWLNIESIWKVSTQSSSSTPKSYSRGGDGGWLRIDFVAYFVCFTLLRLLCIFSFHSLYLLIPLLRAFISSEDRLRGYGPRVW